MKQIYDIFILIKTKYYIRYQYKCLLGKKIFFKYLSVLIWNQTYTRTLLLTSLWRSFGKTLDLDDKYIHIFGIVSLTLENVKCKVARLDALIRKNQNKRGYNLDENWSILIVSSRTHRHIHLYQNSLYQRSKHT